jgi:Mrp family chromosome partitioning ATPase
VGCTLAALVVGWLLTPANAGPNMKAWKSVVTIIPTPGFEEQEQAKLGVLQNFAGNEDVVQKVADRIGEKDLVALHSRVEIVGDTEGGMLTITVSGPTRQEAKELATVYGQVVVKEYHQGLKADAAKSIKERRARLSNLLNRISDLQKERNRTFDAGRKSKLRAEQEGMQSTYQDQVGTLATLESTSDTPPVKTYGSANTNKGDGNILSDPGNRPLRLTLAGVLGLALGVIAALMLDRLDTRLRTRLQAEEAFGYPVIGEIPSIPRAVRRARTPVVTARTDHPAAEAYRSLRAGLLLTGPRTLARRLQGRADDRSLPRAARKLNSQAPVVLVMSALAGCGRTTSVVNLAAALAETGRKVLVLDCDFRNPQVHLYLDVTEGEGMAEVLVGDRGVGLEDVIRDTSVEQVSMVTCGGATAYPAALVVRAGEVFEQARQHADIVLVDCSPLLQANDAYDLVQHSDTVLLVARSGNLTPEQAGRVTELLSRTDVPVSGVTLTDSGSIGAAAKPRRSTGRDLPAAGSSTALAGGGRSALEAGRAGSGTESENGSDRGTDRSADRGTLPNQGADSHSGTVASGSAQAPSWAHGDTQGGGSSSKGSGQ